MKYWTYMMTPATQRPLEESNWFGVHTAAVDISLTISDDRNSEITIKKGIEFEIRSKTSDYLFIKIDDAIVRVSRNQLQNLLVHST